MLLEVTLNTLKKGRITAHQFVIVKLLVDRKLVELNDYIILSNSEKNLQNDLENLELAKYITYDKDNIKDFHKIKVQPDFYKEISNGDFFEEIYMNFPTSVTRTNGSIDYLRTEKTYCKNIYDNLIGRNRSKHEHMLACLKKEVEIRNKEKSFAYMKRLSNWLSSEEWRSFESRLDESIIANNEEGYGTSLE